MKFGQFLVLGLIASVSSVSSQAEHELPPTQLNPSSEKTHHSIEEDAYKGFIRALETKGDALASKSAADEVHNTQVAASLAEILEAASPQVYNVKCFEEITSEKSVHKKDGSVSFSTSDTRAEGIERFDAVITHEGKGRFTMTSERSQKEKLEDTVGKFTATKPVFKGSSNFSLFAGPKKYNYLRSSNEMDISIRLFPLGLKLGDNPKGDFSFTINPLSADGQVYFKVEKYELIDHEKNDSGDVTKTHRRTRITCE